MICTIYSNVMVAGTRYRIHLYTNRLIRYHAALCGDNKFYIYFVQHCQNRNHIMITAEISRFMNEDMHRSAYVVCLGQCGWVQ